MSERQNRVLEKFYSPEELSAQLGFGVEFFRKKCQEGEFTLMVGEVVIAQVHDIGGKLRIPASGVNAWLARHPYRYDAGIKARNRAELVRQIGKQEVIA